MEQIYGIITPENALCAGHMIFGGMNLITSLASARKVPPLIGQVVAPFVIPVTVGLIEHTSPGSIEMITGYNIQDQAFISSMISWSIHLLSATYNYSKG
jgi:hypothetical protein